MSHTSHTTGKIAHLESLYKQLQNPELYVCIRILKSNYDQIGTDTSIQPELLLRDNIRHFKTRESRNSEKEYLNQCLAKDISTNRDLVSEIQQQLKIYDSVSNQSGGKRRIRKTKRRRVKKRSTLRKSK
jgi:hypothetical protein